MSSAGKATAVVHPEAGPPAESLLERAHRAETKPTVVTPRKFRIPRVHLPTLLRAVGIPLVAIALFLLIWSRLSADIHTSLGQIPGPLAVLEQAQVLWADHIAERAKADAFYERQKIRNAARLSEDANANVTLRKYTGKPTYIDQIFTSL